MRKLTLLLALLLLAVLTACDNNDDNVITSNGEEQNIVENNLFGDKTVEEWKEEYKDLIDIDENENGIPDWQEKEITLVYASHFYDDNDELNTLFRAAQKFSEKYPNITVVRDPRFKKSAGDNDYTQLELLLAASQEGTMPDVFYSPLLAEVYDLDLTLDLTPYLRTDEEARYIPQNTLNFLTSFDGQEVVGVAYMSVSNIPAVNVGLLESYNIPAPSFDWTYEDYESIREKIGEVTDSGACVFPGIINFSEIGPHYFDGIQNGWKAYNQETQRFDLSGSPKFGEWLEDIADESIEGWHFYDIDEEVRANLCGTVDWAWGQNREALGTIWFYMLSTELNHLKQNDVKVELYPMPKAPEGGETALQAFYDTLSLSYSLKNDPVKAQAAFELAKWISYSAEGLEARWSLIDEDITKWGKDVEEFIENGGDESDFPLVHPSTNLMDYIMGWPATTNPDVIKNHPFVKGFPEDSEFAIFNFEVFQNKTFQDQLSGPIAFPRNMPAASRVLDEFNIWDVRNQIRDEGYSYSSIALEWDQLLNDKLDEFLRTYTK